MHKVSLLMIIIFFAPLLFHMHKFCLSICLAECVGVKEKTRSRVSYKYIKKSEEGKREGVYLQADINLLAPLSFCRICFSHF